MSRQERVQEALKKEISNIIHEELKDPRLGFVTITAVEITPDLSYAKVFFSVLGKDQDYKRTKEALDSALGFIRRLIAQRIELRLVPEITFKEDRSSEYSIRIEEVLNEIKELNAPRPSSVIKGRTKLRKEGRSEPKKVVACVRKHKNFLITSHTSLEGDALSSELAFYRLIKAMRKNAVIINEDPIPDEYNFLPGINNIKKFRGNLGNIKFDCFVILDCSDLARCGEVSQLNLGGKTILNIDHHISNARFADVNWVEPYSSSASEMVYKLYKELRIPFDEDTAILLYVGMLTDTGSFHYSNTSAFTHKAVSELLTYKLDIASVIKSWPSNLSPFIAINASCGLMIRESILIPLISVFFKPCINFPCVALNNSLILNIPLQPRSHQNVLCHHLISDNSHAPCLPPI